MSTSDVKVYDGNCHCGAVKYKVQLPELKSVSICDCSICHKKGYLYAFLKPDDLTFERGEERLVGYTFGKKNTFHKFCPTCGTAVMEVFHDGKDVGINVRTFRDVDHEALKIKKITGSLFLPPYVPPQFPGKVPDTQGGSSKVYTGSCHCGAVQIALRSKPLPECEIKEDDCSICMRNAYVFVYPDISQVGIVGGENTTGYKFGRKFSSHNFCKICGVPVYMSILGPPKEIFDSWSDARKAVVKKNLDLCPIPLRMLDDVEWDDLKITRELEGQEGYTVE